MDGIGFVLTLAMSCSFWSVFLNRGTAAVFTNVALRKSTIQSSQFGSGYDSYIAVDGKKKTKGMFGIAGICTHTAWHPKEWWMVNLGDIFDIYNITIYGRTDCCDDRFQDFDVYVIAPIKWTEAESFNTVDHGKVIFQHYVRPPTKYININCPDGTCGQFVRLQHRGSRILSLCEVEVYGKPISCVKAAGVSQHRVYPGHRYAGNTVETLPVNSVVHCMVICKNIPCCFAANFNSRTKQCEMKKKNESAHTDELVPENNWNAVTLY